MKILKTISIFTVAVVILAFTSKINPDKTISQTIAEKQDLSTLLTALQSAELLEILEGEGPYTVFAPTNEAFNNLPAGRLDELLAPENKEELVKILKYHVVSGEYYASDLRDGQTLESLEGTQIKIRGSAGMEHEGQMEGEQTDTTDTTGQMGEEGMMEGQQQASADVKINNANIVEKDLVASNGIIHVIDAVIMPSDIEAIGSVEEYK